jgi:hypothetical protein
MGLRADPAPRADQLTRGLAVVTVMLSALFVAWLLVTSTAGPPAHVGTLTIVNETGLAVAVEAVGGDGSAQPLGVLAPTGPTARHEVPDLGETWEFVVSYGGEEVARTPRLRRERLADDGWTVRIAPTPATIELRRVGYL